MPTRDDLETETVPLDAVAVSETHEDHWERQGLEKPKDIIREKGCIEDLNPVVDATDADTDREYIATSRVWRLLAARRIEASIESVEVAVMEPRELDPLTRAQIGVFTEDDAVTDDESEPPEPADDSQHALTDF